ncbi:MAG: hypothetical protein KDK36_18210 [Leptospiraceae bacterium]|nr:hypothetical protein [Leptospiraceae bacterium]
MTTITLEISDPEDAEMILNLAKRLNLKIVEKSEVELLERSKKALEILKQIAERGNLANAIPDPVKWQKEIRKDKPLLGRE